jgi:ribosomal protein L21
MFVVVLCVHAITLRNVNRSRQKMEKIAHFRNAKQTQTATFDGFRNSYVSISINKPIDGHCHNDSKATAIDSNNTH